ncbi:MAG: AraC family transcriptional regulator [Lysobacteraceae bacterium]|nr:MAG: AraC family transcriptional regulator [Xanthomonadaceae bacterium]
MPSHPSGQRSQQPGTLLDKDAGNQPVKSDIVRILLAVATEAGFPPSEWLPEGLLAIDDHGQIPSLLGYAQACAIIRRAVQDLPIPDLGLRVGIRQDVGHFGVLGLAMFSAQTFGEALRIGIRFAPTTGAMLDLSVQEQAPTAGDDNENAGVAICARMRHPDSMIEAFLCEELFVSCINLCRGLLGSGFAPQRLEMAQPRPAYAADMAMLLGCDIDFDCAENRAFIAERWLRTRMPAHHPDSARHTLALCETQLPPSNAERDIVTAVERLLRLRLGTHPRETEIAAELHLTERSLRRRLHAANTSFREIHDRLRCEAADAMLATSTATVADIGTSLGFSDPREFRRAFKRWTGAPPRPRRATRKSHAARDAHFDQSNT